MITQEYLKQIFDYINKDLVWKETRGRALKGSIAGTINSRGYRHIRVDGRFYQAHRLVVIWHGLSLEDDELVDHIDRDRLNNDISNLRVTSHSVNSRNKETNDNIGVWKVGSKYNVIIRAHGKRYYVGRFNSEQEGIIARRKRLEELIKSGEVLV